MSEWRPIETAPRDGQTRLILGAWSATGSTITILALEPLTSRQGDVWRPRAVYGFSIFYPTHWMPLPEPPAA